MKLKFSSIFRDTPACRYDSIKFYTWKTEYVYA